MARLPRWYRPIHHALRWAYWRFELPIRAWGAYLRWIDTLSKRGDR